MRNRYPISGIKQSYRAVPETRTVMMPVAISLVLVGMIAFFFFGKDEPESAQKEVTRVSELDLSDHRETLTGSEQEKDSTSLTSDSRPEMSPLLEEKTSTNAENLPAKENPSTMVFTQWMTPLVLDTYIRKKNEGFSESFWKRGHWITAVEGRWKEGTHEFRIAYEKIQDRKTWQWQYRANQTPDEFHRTALDLRAKGFTLVQSQAFDHPDQKKRYQAVWQKELPATTVAEVSPRPLEPPPIPASNVPREESLTNIPTMPTSDLLPTETGPIIPEINGRHLSSFRDREPPVPFPETEAPRQITPTENFGSNVLNVNRLNFR